MMKKLGVNKKHDAVLMTFYGLKWILLDQLIETGLVRKPIAMKASRIFRLLI